MAENSPDIFNFFKYQWNIDQAREILQKHPRKAIPASVAELRSLGGLIHVDPAHALTVSFEEPVILGWLYLQGKWANILIDGNHRVYEAARRKKKRLLTYVLTSEENYRIVMGPFKEELNPAKTYILDYTSAVSKRQSSYNYSRDGFYRQRIINLLESEGDTNKVLEVSRIHMALTRRDDSIKPKKLRFERLSQEIQTQKCPALRTVDWILFGGQHPGTKIKHRVYFNLDADTLMPRRFCRFIKWFTKRYSQVAYMKIPSSYFYRRFYAQHDSVILYTVLEDPEDLHDLIDACLDKLEALKMTMDREPSEFYVVPEAASGGSFHLELAEIVSKIWKDIADQTSNLEDFMNQAIQASEIDGILTQELWLKGIIL